jgi:hypothetical protein
VQLSHRASRHRGGKPPGNIGITLWRAEIWKGYRLIIPVLRQLPIIFWWPLVPA